METMYRERVRYEDLLLIWLDRINQALQFEEDEKIVKRGLGIERALRSLRAFYSSLPAVIRNEINKRLGKPLLDYLSYEIFYVWFTEEGKYYIYGVIPEDEYKEFKRQLEKCDELRAEKRASCYQETVYDFNNLTLKRIETALRTIIDTLYDYGLLFREDYYLEGVESEDQA